MKNITLSANETLIAAAREMAASEGTTLNARFCEWLEDYVRRKRRAGEAMELIRELRKHVRTGGRKFTRDEMNEREEPALREFNGCSGFAVRGV